MKTLIIHIGYHKTATSSIQKFLAQNSRLLRAKGVNYASTGLGAFQHGALANSLKPESRNRPESRKLWKKLLQEIRQSTCDTTLISSECFLEAKSIPSVLAPILRAKVQVRIICYLRPQLDWLESVYNEIVKDPYRRYTGDVISMREIRAGWHDYHAILSLWSDEFGREAMCVRSFEKSKLKNENIYEDLFAVLQINSIAEFVLPEMQNVSLHPSLTEFLRRCNLIPMLTRTHRNLVEELIGMKDSVAAKLPSLPTTYSRIPPEANAEIERLFDEINRRVGHEYGECRGRDSAQAKFFNEEDDERLFISVEDLLTPEVEREIFGHLTSRLVHQLEQVTDAVKVSKGGSHILPIPSADLLVRMSSIILRQRIEIRMMESSVGASPWRKFFHRLRRLRS